MWGWEGAAEGAAEVGTSALLKMRPRLPSRERRFPGPFRCRANGVRARPFFGAVADGVESGTQLVVLVTRASGGEVNT